MNNILNISRFRTRNGGVRTVETHCCDYKNKISLKNGVYHKMTNGDKVMVDGIVFRIPKKHLQTFVEVENGKVYLVDLDGERVSEALERADSGSGTMRSEL